MDQWIEWRKPYTTEKDNMIEYFETQHKYGVYWFFSIWIGMGWFAIGGWAVNYVLELKNNGFDLAMTIMLPFMMFIVYLFFIKLGHKIRDEWSCRELNALKKDTAMICGVPAITTERRFAGRTDNHRARYNYYIKVEIMWQGQLMVMDVSTSKYQYSQVKPGETVIIFNPSETNPYKEYLSAYAQNWLNEMS